MAKSVTEQVAEVLTEQVALSGTNGRNNCLEGDRDYRREEGRDYRQGAGRGGGRDRVGCGQGDG